MEKKYSLYIHIPFCAQKCFYCSFVVFVGQKKRMADYIDCVEKEMRAYKGKRIHSVYIGGGTPGFLEEGLLSKLFSDINKNFLLNKDIEITIESNPESLNISKLRLLKKMGVNRLSIGVQSLNDKYLKILGRAHDRQIAVDSYAVAREAGFKNINLDLMYGFPGQTDYELKRDVEGILGLNSDHLSLYSLNVEKNSLFFARKLILPDKERQAEQYLMVLDLIKGSGFKQYEVSNFSRNKKNSAHNINYWLGGNYIGLGVGAHSHDNGHRYWNCCKLLEYIRKINNGASVIEGSEFLSKEERLIESLLFGLRMTEGVCLEELERYYGCGFDGKRMKMMADMEKEGLLEKKKNITMVTGKGVLVLDEISAYLI